MWHCMLLGVYAMYALYDLYVMLTYLVISVATHILLLAVVDLCKLSIVNWAKFYPK